MAHNSQVILDMLKRDGPQEASVLARQIGISSAAVRQHLGALYRKNFVDYRPEPRPVGRPAKVWCLTSNANSLFPDSHGDLTASLIRATECAFGEDGLKKVVDICAREQSLAYMRRMPKDRSVETRLEALVSLRNEEGYMARLDPQPDGSFILVENHCPIAAVASCCQQLCEAEQATFRMVLGSNVTLERLEHMHSGQRRCAYRIVATKAESSAAS